MVVGYSPARAVIVNTNYVYYFTVPEAARIRIVTVLVQQAYTAV